MKFHLLKQAVAGVDVPAAVFDNLTSARENELRAILYALKTGQADPVAIATDLGMSLSAAQRRLLYWADLGLVRAEETEEKPKRKRRPTSPRILQVAANRPEIATLVNELQKIYGKALNERATNTFVGLYLEEGVPVDVILLLTVFLAPRQKGPGYTARVIQGLYNKKGITSPSKAEEYISLSTKREQAYRKVRQIFSLDRGKFNSSEKTIIDSWFETLGMSYDMVEAAFIASGTNSTIRYCNGILKSWSQNGYKAPGDIPPSFGRQPAAPDISPENDIIIQNMHKVPVFEEG